MKKAKVLVGNLFIPPGKAYYNNWPLEIIFFFPLATVKDFKSILDLPLDFLEILKKIGYVKANC